MRPIVRGVNVIRDLPAALLSEIVAINVRSEGAAPDLGFRHHSFDPFEGDVRLNNQTQRQLDHAAGKLEGTWPMAKAAHQARKQAAERKLAAIHTVRSVCRHWRDSVDYSCLDCLDLDFSRRSTCPAVPAHLFTGCTHINLTLPGHHDWDAVMPFGVPITDTGTPIKVVLPPVPSVRPTVPPFVQMLPTLEVLVLQGAGMTELPAWLEHTPLKELDLDHCESLGPWLDSAAAKLPSSLRTLVFPACRAPICAPIPECLCEG